MAHLLADVEGVQDAYLYGSWAAREAGEQGLPPGDVDVLVVGSIDLDDLHEAASAAEQRLGRSVSIRRVLPEHWTAESGFAAVTSSTSR